jgi:hypothetical protein
MDRHKPETPAGGYAGQPSTEASVASGTSARVGEILSKSEARAASIRQQAERSAEDTRLAARREAERVAGEVRAAAEAAARDRVREISELRASIAARAGSLVEGLEGGELTAARLEELVAALGEAADRVLDEIGGDVRASRPAPRAAPLPDSRPVRPSDPGDGKPVPIADPLPEGAPIAHRPARASSARFAAVVMAIQGSDRDEVAQRLEREHGVADSDALLDDVFGRADTPA